MDEEYDPVILEEEVPEENTDWDTDAMFEEATWDEVTDPEDTIVDSLAASGTTEQVIVVGQEVNELDRTFTLHMMVDMLPRTRVYPVDFLPPETMVQPMLEALITAEFNPSGFEIDGIASPPILWEIQDLPSTYMEPEPESEPEPTDPETPITPSEEEEPPEIIIDPNLTDPDSNYTEPDPEPDPEPEGE